MRPEVLITAHANAPRPGHRGITLVTGRSSGWASRLIRCARPRSRTGPRTRPGPGRRAAPVISCRARSGPVPQVGPGQLHRRVRAEQRQRLGVRLRVGQLAAGQQLDQPGVAGPGRSAGRAARAGSARPRAGRCPGSCRTGRSRWRRPGCRRRAGRPRRAPPQAWAIRAATPSGAPENIAPNRPEVAISERGLVGHDLHVVLERVLARLRAHGLRDLPADQPGEGLGLDPDGLRAEVGEDVRGAGEQEVAGQDGHRVVPAGVRARRCRAGPSASSITSSWYSVARWVSSIATAPGTSRSSVRVAELARPAAPAWRGSRLPPASIRCADGLVEQRRCCALAAFPQAVFDQGEPVGHDLSRAPASESCHGNDG